MTEAGERLIEGAKEALAIARGEQPAARLHIDGHAYVPVSALKFLEEQNEALMQERSNIIETNRGHMEREQAKTASLVSAARKLVELLDDAERYHGSLIGPKTLTAVNELRLELSKWQK